ncbi:hypothetical protein COCC4DRAFT_69812 [Bipolaris maydis ATCC 48331]|uniref:Uncharacterized protein n=2 Tax=Cochliobolus heterostrophus TaxID=5016 RepID=M2UXA4_COCH5|nr:uncharacterized protein COCC4DRAFT_69812 [Bipolaris maydis ATCC 48331]EMD92453.1 hypothetical protein COCHEDRAFT_1224277 [Bipolaris maydis C5]KAH7552881.1 hypothetical protein BM1_07854 [Bipolaris maydis]ENI08147.1 hypothetical protein COCC4DRAFT_69812 [Bipolaris maydis ATCC 48331]KAJ5022280.1 hypothetical protein J3E73DRAFT_385364 [Bipolaris maydis]KAJ6272222.1 hypothetical protein PSV08DRAFT_200292 [Bipolaris maydis]
MSSITPTSFIDDAISLTNRLPRGLGPHQVAQWLSQHGSDTSAYTGSFIDDNVDSVLRDSGVSSSHVRDHGKEKRKHEKGHVWNERVQKAVSGDVQRHVDKIRGLRGCVRVQKVGGVSESEKKKEKVSVPLPREWGTFVIREKDGRVVVVDEEGEFDSGGQQQLPRWAWVRAESTVQASESESVRGDVEQLRLEQQMGSSRSVGIAKTARRRHREFGWSNSQGSPTKVLSPIPESECESGCLPSGSETTRSPRDFMMSGANAWSPHTRPSAVSTVGSASESWDYRSSKSVAEMVKKGYRHVKPVSWETRHAGDAWEVDGPGHWYQNNGSTSSSKSKKSTKSCSTYKAPTVEDASSTSSGGDGRNLPHPYTWAASPSDSVGNWSRRPKAADNPAWTGIQAYSSQQHVLNNTPTTRSSSEVTWDGFERDKTLSDVSIAGSSSTHGCPSNKSMQSNHHDTGRRSTSREQIRAYNQHGWEAHGSSGRGTIRYANGFDEDNATYLNANWGGTPVRVTKY